MTGAILILIIALIVGLALFILILFTSTVKEHTFDADDEEISVTYFDTATKEKSPAKRNSIRSHSPIRIIHSIHQIMKLFFSKIQSSINSVIKTIQSIQVQQKESSKKASKQARINQDKEIQMLVKEREEENPVIDNSELISKNVDTSFLEKSSASQSSLKTKSSSTPKESPDSKTTRQTFSALDKKSRVDDSIHKNPEDSTNTMETPKEDLAPKPKEQKADSFVQGLLSDPVETEYMDSFKQPVVDTISDSYYFSYMEKRYIDKIMKNAKDIAAYKKLGDLYVEMNNLTDAKECYAVVLKLKPQDDLTRKKMKEILHKIEK